MREADESISRFSNGQTGTVFDQVCSFLSDPKSHGQENRIEVITTHAARIFLSETMAYKIKLPITYDYLDFSTLSRRKAVCERELEINKPHAPKIYESVVAIRRSDDGQLSFDDIGPPVEWAIKMRRFPESNILLRIARRGELSNEIGRRLGHKIAQYHLGLEPMNIQDGSLRISEIIEELKRELAVLLEFIDEKQQQTYFKKIRSEFGAVRHLLDQRAQAGMIRRCHGDLHLRNLVMLDDQPTLFDALEFDERLATTDILYDLAFLLMDMRHEGLRQQTNETFNRYILEAWAFVERSGFAVMPLFLSVRAAIRAMVSAQTGLRAPNKLQRQRTEARRYLSQAIDFLKFTQPILVICAGFSGSGKSTLAAEIAPMVGRAPGAVLVQSDLERKAILGIGEFEKAPASQYTEAARKLVYERMIEKASTMLRQGQSVVLDAVFADEQLRNLCAAIVASTNSSFVGLWLSAPKEELINRVQHRQRDASDADQDVVRYQLEHLQQPDFLKEKGWHEIDASEPISAVVAQAMDFIEHSNQETANSEIAC